MLQLLFLGYLIHRVLQVLEILAADATTCTTWVDRDLVVLDDTTG